MILQLGPFNFVCWQNSWESGSKPLALVIPVTYPWAHGGSDCRSTPLGSLNVKSANASSCFQQKNLGIQQNKVGSPDHIDHRCPASPSISCVLGCASWSETNSHRLPKIPHVFGRVRSILCRPFTWKIPGAQGIFLGHASNIGMVKKAWCSPSFPSRFPTFPPARRDLGDTMPDRLSNKMSDEKSDKMPERMSDKVSEAKF